MKRGCLYHIKCLQLVNFKKKIYKKKIVPFFLKSVSRQLDCLTFLYLER